MMWKDSAMKCAALAFAVALSAPAIAADDGWQAQVGEALGKTGSAIPGGIYRVGLPRTDLKATLDGVELKAGFALGSWLAFEKMGDSGMVMGDLVLTMDEVSPVMKKLIEGGIEVTALHNHLLRNQPFTMYMHVLGHGDPVKLAATLHTALAESKTPFAAAPRLRHHRQSISTPPRSTRRWVPKAPITAVSTNLAFRAPNRSRTALWQSRRRWARLSRSISSRPGGGKAAITGDFVLIAKEVNPVAKALREHGIEVTALHNHMLDDEPRLFFMHFWANDDAKKLAEGLKSGARSDQHRKELTIREMFSGRWVTAALVSLCALG